MQKIYFVYFASIMKKHLIILIVVLLISCSHKEKEEEYYSRHVSEKLSALLINHFSSNDSFPLPPPPNLNVDIYVKIKNDSICKTDILNLYYTYLSLNTNTEKENLEDFIYNTINQKTIFGSGLYFYPNKCFILTESITKFYNKHTFNSFLNMYCKNQSDETYHFKDNMKKEIPTISYYLYLNNYGVSRDCVSGYQIIHKSVF